MVDFLDFLCLSTSYPKPVLMWGGLLLGLVRVGRDRVVEAELGKELGVLKVVIKERGKEVGGVCVSLCVTMTWSGMGTSVCLHLDELVSQWPLGRACQ